jgi:hypothetical protein
MRMLVSLISVPLFLAPALAHPFSEPRPRQARQVVIPTQFERHVEELRGGEAHADHYLVIRLEIEALRRDNPEHREFLDRYLLSLLPR